MKTYWISLRAIKQHEFRSTLRYIKSAGATWHDIYVRLGELQEIALKALLKSYSGIVVYYLALSALGSQTTVSITIQGVTASLPTAVVTAVASVGTYVIAMHAQGVMMLIALRTHEGARLSLHGFSMGAYGLYNGQDELHLPLPIIGYGAFTERLPITMSLSLNFLAIVTSLLLPILAFWIYLLTIQLEIIGSDQVDGAFKVVAAFGILALVSTIFYLVLMNLPLPMRKNKMFLRFNLLCKLHPVGEHPQLRRWLDEDSG